MIYKTLHWYILKDLLRIFFLTTASLNTMLAFCGIFKPLTQGGLELPQLLLIIVNSMPAMLPISIALAALFAAVLTYWRLATDNELTAARAGGVSYRAIVLPALLLGLAVSAADVVCVHYVVPVFAQRVERILRRDAATFIVYNAGQESVTYENLHLYADSGTKETDPNPPPGVTQRNYVALYGAAVMQTDKDGKAKTITIAGEAHLVLDEVPLRDETQISIQVVDGAVFTLDKFEVATGSIQAVRGLDGSPLAISSMLKRKAKFLNYSQLQTLAGNLVELDPGLHAQLDAIKRTYRFQQIAAELRAAWKPDQPLVFPQKDPGNRVEVLAPRSDLNAEQQLVFRNAGSTPVRIDQYRAGRHVRRFQANSATVILNDDAQPLYGAGPAAAKTITALELGGPIERTELIPPRAPVSQESGILVQPMELPHCDLSGVADLQEEALRSNPAAFSPAIKKMADELRDKMIHVAHGIGAELQSRASFTLACLFLVMLGASLGILMRGQNPLFVFVVGFVPAIVLVLLITAGRMMAEKTLGSVTPGYITIWGGNILLLLLLAGIYVKLLRQ